MPPKAASPLLSEPDVRRWYQNIGRGSAASADINLRRVDEGVEDHRHRERDRHLDEDRVETFFGHGAESGADG